MSLCGKTEKRLGSVQPTSSQHPQETHSQHQPLPLNYGHDPSFMTDLDVRSALSVWAGLTISHAPASCVVLVQITDVILNSTRKKLDLSPRVADRTIFIWQISWQVGLVRVITLEGIGPPHWALNKQHVLCTPQSR